ncbi:MAG: NAD(+) synthase [Clostridia bacterium]|nr:NAD(+) synthase [Clostridia bacterium]
MCDKIKVASVSPEIFVGSPTKNCDEIINALTSLKSENINIIAFPELCLSGYTCGDLFNCDILTTACNQALNRIIAFSNDCYSHIIVGSPIKNDGKLYNCAVHIFKGKIVEIVSKEKLSLNELRWFSKGYSVKNGSSEFDIVIGDDIYNKATVCDLVVNISAVPSLVTRYNTKKEFVKKYTKARNCIFVLSSAGACESTTDFVFSGDCIHAVSGAIISEGKRFSLNTEIIISELNPIKSDSSSPVYLEKNFVDESDAHPFIPNDKNLLSETCDEILSIQSTGLAKRMKHIRCNKLVLGISGGLDSTHALLVCIETLKKLNLPIENLICITMPGFGTTDLTYTNACNLVKLIGATLKEINVKDASLQHFKDIGHNVDVHDVTYENTQARERTQILMDYANKIGAIVVGTGDLSELALGWCTYNGDHMSMYGVNASVPKTLMRHLVMYVADKSDEKVSKTLYSIVNTPVSPELLPPDKNGKMEQKTETTLGPYEVHDYFIYHFIKNKKTPEELLEMSIKAFKGKYTENELKTWLITFVKRFFNNQFKRSCMPDGPAVGSISLSPRSSWIMPSDAVYDDWLKF